MPNPLIVKYGENITRKYTLPGEYDETNGVWVPGAEVSETIFAAVLPLDTMKLLTQAKPEGFETNHGLTIYSDTLLNESNEDTKQAPDLITWDGRDYVIYSCSHRYQIASLAHFKSIAFLKNS